MALHFGIDFKRTLVTTLVATGIAVSPSFAADFSDPTWPCIQKKVLTLSIGLMWPHPLTETTDFSAPVQAAASDLSARFALRRLSLKELQPALDAFVAQNKANQALLGYVFDLTFKRIAAQRRSVLTGIENLSLKQLALAKQIKSTRIETERLWQASKLDNAKIDALEKKRAWDERIYTDRQKTLTYVCESPVLLEKRLFAISQMLLAAIPDTDDTSSN